jgi:hypothetical protein
MTVDGVSDGLIGFIAPYTFTHFGTTDNYSVVAILHTFQFTVTHSLGFSIFNSLVLGTDLSQSRCNLKSHVKSSFPVISSRSSSSAISRTGPSSLYSPVRLHGAVLNWLSTGTTSLFTLLFYIPSRLLTVPSYKSSARTQ